MLAGCRNAETSTTSSTALPDLDAALMRAEDYREQQELRRPRARHARYSSTDTDARWLTSAGEAVNRPALRL